MNNLPEAFVERMAGQLGNELPAFLAAMEQPAFRGIRVNPMKHVQLPDLQEPVPWEPTGFYLKDDSTIGAQPLHEAGACYIQDPSAMLPAAVLDAKPG